MVWIKPDALFSGTVLVFIRNKSSATVHCCLLARPSRSADRLIVVLGHASPTIKPPDTAVDSNYETQPGAMRDEKGGGGTMRSIMEELLFFELRL
jgi:hypothetical protein